MAVSTDWNLYLRRPLKDEELPAFQKLLQLLSRVLLTPDKLHFRIWRSAKYKVFTIASFFEGPSQHEKLP